MTAALILLGYAVCGIGLLALGLMLIWGGER
jgi:hypothetical protein